MWGSPIPIGDGDGDVNRFPDEDGDGDEDEAKKRGWGWPNTTNSWTAKPDKGHAPDISKTHASILSTAPRAPPWTNTGRGRTLASANTIIRGPLPDKRPTPDTNSYKRNTRKP
ncbi:hypothetical protein Tco_1088353 [Tanacetum coccineum]